MAPNSPELSADRPLVSASDALLAELATLLARYAARAAIGEAHGQAAAASSGADPDNRLQSGHRDKRDARKRTLNGGPTA